MRQERAVHLAQQKQQPLEFVRLVMAEAPGVGVDREERDRPMHDRAEADVKGPVARQFKEGAPVRLFLRGEFRLGEERARDPVLFLG